MNPIKNAIHNLDPDYTITDDQIKEIETADDPHATAKQLPEQVDNLRKEIAKGLGVKKENISIGDALSIATLDRAVSKHAGNDPKHQSSRLSRDRILRIGNETVDGLWAVYREVLGREPDESGYKFWKNHYDNGMKLSDIVRHIEESPENNI